MSQKIATNIGHKLIITPELRQNIGLLSLSNEALLNEISNALDQNPFLEIQTPPIEKTDPYKRKLKGTPNSLTSKTYQNLRDIPSTTYKFAMTEKGRAGEGVSKLTETNENFPTVLGQDSQSLSEHLCLQLETSKITQKFQMIAFALIDAIGSDGLLSEPLETIVETLLPYLTTNLKEIEKVLRIVQGFDPSGVGARNLRECFLLQLSSLGDEIDYREAAQELVKDHYELLQQPNRDIIAKSMNLSNEEVDEVLTVLEQLETRPGNAFNDEQITYVVPDVIAYRDGNKWTAILNENALSNITVKELDIRKIHAVTKKERAFLKIQLQKARLFTNGLRQRNRILLECSKQIVHAQQEFFEFGEIKLNALRLSDIAIPIGCHESTVSRISRNKFLQTPRGTYELKYFFSKSLNTSSGGYVSSKSIKQHIKEWTRNEDPLHPLSDSAIVKKLKGLGIKIARRTIAKYRQNMGIPGSNHRKI